MPIFARAAIATAAAVLLAVAVPVSASAASSPYTPGDPADWSLSVCPGGSASFHVPAGTFTPRSPLVETVTGTAAAAPVLGTFLSAQTSGALTSAADGSADLKITFGNSGTGSYNVTVAEQGAQNSSSGTVTVFKQSDPRCDPAAQGSSAGPSGLAFTGSSVALGAVWAAGGAVVLGAAGLLAVAARKRARTRD